MISFLLLFRGIITVYTENNTELINTLLEAGTGDSPNP
jgi:hypothetical protein